MKDHMWTLLDTHGNMIAKVTMKKKVFLINMATYVSKCLKTYVKDET